jgi:hypothetical protein
MFFSQKFLFLVCLFVYDKVLLCSPGWPLTCNPPASASGVLKLQARTTMLR